MLLPCSRRSAEPPTKGLLLRLVRRQAARLPAAQ
jgi:hypothetical protein